LINADRDVFKPLRSTFERYADVFGKLGYPIGKNEMETMSKKPMSNDFATLLENHTRKVIGIAPFAAFKGKMYPLDLMKKVVLQLDRSESYKLVLFGGGISEIEILASWEKQFKNCISAAGKLSFSEELGFISNLDLMLAMDSGNAHLAAMYAVPTVTIWGVTHPYAGFSPFNQPQENALLSDRSLYPAIPT
ncbi:unnamed protein product, partial [Ectocarpus sp. 12 AP-2014]